jgi:Tol biopolymer transport system component
METMLVLLLGLAGLAFSALAGLPEVLAFDWSPDGSQFLLVSGGSIYLSSDPNLQDLSPLYAGLHAEYLRFATPEWFVFSGPWEDGFALWRGFVSGKEPELLYRAPQPILWPTVSADGTKVAFVLGLESIVVLELVEEKAQVVVGGAWPKAGPEFTPNGWALLFCGLWPPEGGGSWELFYFDLRSRDLIQLTSDEFFDWCPRISPDGTWIAFVSNRGGSADIWILSLLGGPAFPLTQDPWLDAFPAWAPDGTQVGYLSFRPEGWVFLRAGAY